MIINNVFCKYVRAAFRFGEILGPIWQKKQSPGFWVRDMGVIDNGYKYTSHVLKVPTSDVIRVA